ncbi:uncharacterized protein RSE6_00945 [Rhynchosporium secalis]|uniref:Uncharacterized protein n=1 Tax=Rhynchosporium secalis TaxID=38038 RepID=A0A1E1LWJ6_RHYSE|nr:uncharacterized protein RSE6_00945 [Rhynchosporium secalis]
MTYNTTKTSLSASQGYSKQESCIRRKNHPSSSARPPNRVSFNLASLVTKFEALDALNLTFTKTTLHPAPGQVSRKHSTRKGTTGSNYRSRLSTIFSPRRGSPAKHDHEFSNEDIQAVQAEVFDSSKTPETARLKEKLDARRLEKEQTLYEPSNIMSRDGVEDITDVPQRGAGSIAAPYIQNEIPDEKRRGSLRDRIQVYDGVSAGDTPRANPTTTANTATPTTPVSFPRSRLLDKSYFLTPSTGSSKRTCAELPDVDAVTPTRSARTSIGRQSLKFGPVQNRPLNQTSPGGSFHSDVTSKAAKGTRQYGNGQDASPSRIAVQRQRLSGPIRERRNTTVATKAQAASGTGGDGSVPPPTAGDDESDKLSSRRIVSSKIEELYRARSLEVKRDNARGTAKQPELTANLSTEASKRQLLEKKTVESRPGKLAEITRTKVAAMRKLFDGKFSPKSASPEPCCGLDPILDAVDTPSSPPSSPPEERIHEQTSVTPPAPEWCGLSPTPTPSPKTLSQVIDVKPSNIAQAPGVSERANAWEKSMTGAMHSSSLTKKASPTRSKLIEEKLKKFENTSESAQPGRGKMFRRRLSKSLRSIFEISSRRSQEEEPGKSKPPVALAKYERTWSPVGEGAGIKRGTIVERWAKTPTAFSSQGDGTASERESISLSEDVEFGKMIRKSAECSLRQPRPVRAVEMQSMARICKDRVGGTMDRDKGERFRQRRNL